MEKGETIEQTALREVAEETGLSRLSIKRPLEPTYHIYPLKGKRVLKTTHWFLMHHAGDGKFKIQTEEDIEDARWLAKPQWRTIQNNIQRLFR